MNIVIAIAALKKYKYKNKYKIANILKLTYKRSIKNNNNINSKILEITTVRCKGVAINYLGVKSTLLHISTFLL